MAVVWHGRVLPRRGASPNSSILANDSDVTVEGEWATEAEWGGHMKINSSIWRGSDDYIGIAKANSTVLVQSASYPSGSSSTPDSPSYDGVLVQ